MDTVSVQLDISTEAITITDLDKKEEVVYIRDNQTEEEYNIIRFLLLQLHGKGVYGAGEKLAGKTIMARAKTEFGEGPVSKVLLAYISDD